MGRGHYFCIDLIKLPLIQGDMEHAIAALSDPTRREIIEMLAGKEMPAGAIASRFDMSAPAVSQHLKVLKEAKLVTVRADAQRRLYSLNKDGFEEMDEWLSRIRRYWSKNLDALEKILRDQDKAKGKK
jgi:DNA-binding transcriptional ArsR family regulator